MASTFETGHAKNAAHFEILITYCTAYGVSYNPSKATLTLDALAALRANAVAALANLHALSPAYINAVNEREAVFSPLRKHITRIISAVNASDVRESVKADVKTIIRKLQGRRANVKKDPETATESVKSVSVAQLSFDQRIENMDKLIQLLAAQPAYTPNEADLTVASLAALLADLRAANTAAVTAYIPISNARISRNTVFYQPATGLVDVAINVKMYVKSVFGATSPQYKQVSGLKFTKIKS